MATNGWAQLGKDSRILTGRGGLDAVMSNTRNNYTHLLMIANFIGKYPQDRPE